MHNARWFQLTEAGADEPGSPSASERNTDWLHVLPQTMLRADIAGIVAYVALSIGSALAGSVAAVFLVPLINTGSPGPLGRISDMGSIGLQAAAFVAISTGFSLLRWWSARLGARLVSRYGMNLRRIVHERLIGAQLACISRSTSAEIANVLTHNVEVINQGFSAVLQLLIAGITATVSLGLAFWFCPQLMLAAPLFVIFGAIGARARSHEQSQASRQYIADMTKLFWLSEDFPRRLRHVRSFQREDVEKANFADASSRLQKGYQHQLELAACGRLTIEILAVAGIAVILVSAHLWRGVDQASLIAAGLLVARLLPYFVSARQSLQQLRSAAPALELWARYTSFVDDRKVAHAERSTDARAALLIRRVMWSSRTTEINIGPVRLAPGEMTLIAGDSGNGKSMLLDILSGMMPPQVFDASMAQTPITFGEYRERVRNSSYVGQSVRPWQATVRECLLWAAPAATNDMMSNALSAVDFNPGTLRRLLGTDALLRQSLQHLSGGELQRLLLAQVILKQPFLALLDETTNALDAASEKSILRALRRCLPNTILIVVSHRPDVASIANQCLRIDAGGSPLPQTLAQ